MFKLFDFSIICRTSDDVGSDDDDAQGDAFVYPTDKNKFIVQMFGINEKGEQASIFAEGFQPFFYLKVDETWDVQKKQMFYSHIKSKITKYYAKSITECILVNRRKLYGFDNCKKHRFIKLTFANVPVFNKVKNWWFRDILKRDGTKERVLNRGGYYYEGTHIELYEAQIPPLLRFFHLKELSPSGWVRFLNKKYYTVADIDKRTTCQHEFIVDYKNIVPVNDKETMVPYKKMSMDIEASSSHGDFPVPIKSYKKLATNIIDALEPIVSTIDTTALNLRSFIRTAFGFENMHGIERVFYKGPSLSDTDVNMRLDKWLCAKVASVNSDVQVTDEMTIESMFEAMNAVDKNENKNDSGDDDDAYDDENADDVDVDVDVDVDGVCERDVKRTYLKGVEPKTTIIDIVMNPIIDRNVKIEELMRTLRTHFPQLEGDKVTFIGSTFMRYGDIEPYLNHCIVLNGCTVPHDVQNIVIETYDTEREVLLAWKGLVQKESPDIVIGYNIFGFDYEFMFRRAQELGCVEEFLKLSKNKDEICKSDDFKNADKIDIDRSTTTLASGTYDLSIIKMAGRLQVDMLSWFRRTENLTSYKLDHVGSSFIGDDVKRVEFLEAENITRMHTKNMVGLYEGSFVHFEEINHSSDYYKNGAKFKVIGIDKTNGWFDVSNNETPAASRVRWGLAKDDVSPKDIFRMTNEGPEARAVIAKYCIQDCNLVHYLFNKVDVMTSLVEMSSLCSVPMSFLIFRGQGIKLTSYVAKKCREKGVLMPVINKGGSEGYEGAIVLPPKCGLYLKEAVCVGDFASLYPSSMLSENLCPSSKVSARSYDLVGNLVGESGVRGPNGEFLYDNLPNHEYVDIQFDTFEWVRARPTAKAEKIKSGHKICRFVQPTTNAAGDEEKAIMPSILQDLLRARKSTRKLIPQTSDEFMRNVLDKRQLAYKVTANSLYGQLGARTSTFYEPDIAASTTATGRLLLTYAKRVVEECYDDIEMTTKDGTRVHIAAEYIYGDTDSVFFKFNLTDKATNEKITGQRSLELSIEIAQLATHNVSKFLKQPHDFEYEKTYMPFCLLSKKRYVAIKYEFDPNKGKRNEMGIVLKRRDNAPIVKDIYGGTIDILMNEQNIEKALAFVHTCLKELIVGNVEMDKLIITKSLRSFYKCPQSIAHKVLADRIGLREPGNKPTSGDRIAYVYFVTPKTSKGKKILQGDKIETPAFIRENGLRIDYSFYISNQIMKPLLQLFGLVLEELWIIGKKKTSKKGKVKIFQTAVDKIRAEAPDDKKADEKIAKLKDKEVKAWIFDEYLTKMNNVKNGNREITSFYEKTIVV